MGQLGARAHHREPIAEGRGDERFSVLSCNAWAGAAIWPAKFASAQPGLCLASTTTQPALLSCSQLLRAPNHVNDGGSRWGASRGEDSHIRGGAGNRAGRWRSPSHAPLSGSAAGRGLSLRWPRARTLLPCRRLTHSTDATTFQHRTHHSITSHHTGLMHRAPPWLHPPSSPSSSPSPYPSSSPAPPTLAVCLSCPLTCPVGVVGVVSF